MTYVGIKLLPKSRKLGAWIILDMTLSRIGCFEFIPDYLDYCVAEPFFGGFSFALVPAMEVWIE